MRSFSSLRLVINNTLLWSLFNDRGKFGQTFQILYFIVRYENLELVNFLIGTFLCQPEYAGQFYSSVSSNFACGGLLLDISVDSS